LSAPRPPNGKQPWVKKILATYFLKDRQKTIFIRSLAPFFLVFRASDATIAAIQGTFPEMIEHERLEPAITFRPIPELKFRATMAQWARIIRQLLDQLPSFLFNALGWIVFAVICKQYRSTLVSRTAEREGLIAEIHRVLYVGTAFISHTPILYSRLCSAGPRESPPKS
jgi:hypothetical protein